MTTQQLANRIRRHAVEMAKISKNGHTSGVLSIAEIVAVLYNETMNIYPNLPRKNDRDRLVLSEGHVMAAVTAALAEMGYYSKEDLYTKFSDGGKMSLFLYPDSIPGVDYTTGTLGTGFGVAVGMAYVAKKDGKLHRVFSILGDGECNEGSVWESAMFAGHNKLAALTAIVNYNKIQCQGRTESIISLLNIGDRFRDFGFHTIEVNGHDIDALRSALKFQHGEKPVCIIAHTVKGKGVSFMQNNILWHSGFAEGKHYEQAIREIEVETI